MKAQNSALRVITNDTSAWERRPGRVAVGVILVLASFTLLPLIATDFMQPEESKKAQPVPAEAVPPTTEYFPAQYVNQAQNALPEEHIQAF